MPNKITDKILAFYQTYKAQILSAIVAIYIAPPALFYSHNYGIEGSWKRAINMAVNNGTIFGTDFIYTFGPLGFLSTRNNEYVGNWLLIISDILLVFACYYFLLTFFKKNKGWFLLALTSMFLVRSAEYTQIMFLIFVIYTIQILQNKFKNKLQLVITVLLGTLLFFIKVNYGIIALFVLSIIMIYLIFNNLNAFLLVLSIFLATIFIITHYCHINIIGYILYSFELIKYYNESMYLPIKLYDPVLILAFIQILIVSILSYLVIKKQVIEKNFNLVFVMSFILFALTFYLFYKNGFTRANIIHYGAFFSILPFSIISVIFLFNIDKSKCITIGSIIISLSCSVYVQLKYNIFNIKHDLTFAIPGYSSQYFKKEASKQENILIPKNKLASIGNETIDIFPYQIALIQINGLNYCPRPLPQSYSFSSPLIDSLNADHFYKTSKPANILIRNEGIDKNYNFWNESYTKATISLNYYYCNTISLKKDTLETDVYNENYLLLKATKQAPRYPLFTKIEERKIFLGERINFSFSDTELVYFTAEINYNLIGKLRKFIFQVPATYIKLHFSDSTSQTYPAFRPEICRPVLINKAILNNIDLKNFFSKNLKAIKNIVGFEIFSKDIGCQPEISITFQKFKNY